MGSPTTTLDVVRVRMELAEPWITTLGEVRERNVVLVRAAREGVIGWGECVAMPEPTYTGEDADGAAEMIRRHLLPRVAPLLSDDPPSPTRSRGPASSAGRDPSQPRLPSWTPLASAALEAMAPVRGNRMAKAGIECALLDLELRTLGISLVDHLSAAVGQGPHRVSVPAGAAVGVTDDLDALMVEVGRRVEEQHYRRVKLKIHPGWDLEPVRAIRSAWGPERLAVMVDANGSYAGVDDPAMSLGGLDQLGLDCIEQPLGVSDLVGHAALAARLSTPICLDETIESADDLRTAVALAAGSVVNLKVGRVGGVAESVRIYRVATDEGIGLWIGGMLETGVGRAVNVAMAALPGVNLTGDISGSDRFWRKDLIGQTFVVDRQGMVAVPTGPGSGVDVLI